MVVGLAIIMKPYVHAVFIDHASEAIEVILTPVHYFDCQESSSSSATVVHVCQIGTEP